MAEPTLPNVPESSETPREPTTAGAPSRGTARRRPALKERARVGGEVREGQRSGPAFGLSVLLHVVAAVVVFQLLTFGHGLRFFERFTSTPEVQERLVFIEQAPAPVAAVPPPTQVTTATATPAVRPPVVGPVVSPVTPGASPVTAASPDTGGGSARATGANGVGALDPDLRGVKPGYTDARVWTGPPGPGAPAPRRNGAERLDSVISVVLTQAADSLDSIARASGAYGRKPGDWTRRDKDGNRWGWDNTGIRLGKVTIPNALLSLLPLNAQNALSSNPVASDRAARLSLAREDIQRMSAMGQGDAEFRKLANELRERRERERRSRLRAPDASVVESAKKPGGS